MLVARWELCWSSATQDKCTGKLCLDNENLPLCAATIAPHTHYSPSNSFYCKRGVRQGDPLSPLLFVLAAELLQCIMNRWLQNGIFTLPIEDDPSNKLPIIQYADDTILVMRASQIELFCLKGILQSFAKSTGLKVNYSKSNIIPLNLSEDQAQNFASTFGCKFGGLPFTYLGLPLGTTKLKIIDLMPLVDKT